MGTFEERVAGEKASLREKQAAADASETRLDDQVTAARSAAFEFKPTVEAAVTAVAHLPLPSSYKATEQERRWANDEYLLKGDGPFHQGVRLIENFKKPTFGKKGTVSAIGWTFSISSARFASASLCTNVYPNGSSTFSVRTPVLMAGPPPEYSLDQFCDLGLVRWDGGTYKDSSWRGGVLPVQVALDEFVTLAAKPERVKGDETTSYADWMSASWLGSLIHATSGSFGGVGGRCRNRAGLAW